MIEISITGWAVPSHNKTNKRHWSVESREKKKLLACIRSQMSLDDICGEGHHRYVEIMCWRKRLITDDANYRAGAKGLVDSLVTAGALHDDADKFVTVTYLQDVRSKCPIKGREMTRIRISVEPFESGK